jgi:hypothetical protein
MSPVQLSLAALCGAVPAAAGFRIWSARRFRALRWPAQLGYYGFRRRVMRYLSRAGWTIDRRTPLQVDFFATRSRKQFAVICLPSTMAVTRSRVRDLASLPPAATRGNPVVCVTLEEPSGALVEDAAVNSVRIIWYKDLATF